MASWFVLITNCCSPGPHRLKRLNQIDVVAAGHLIYFNLGMDTSSYVRNHLGIELSESYCGIEPLRRRICSTCEWTNYRSSSS